MLDHGLECVAYALKLRQSHLLPVGAPPETQAAQAEAWTACAAYAALLHDIGKLAVDLHVEFADGERWHPWHGAPSRRSATRAIWKTRPPTAGRHFAARPGYSLSRLNF